MTAAVPRVLICISTTEGSGPSRTLLELLARESAALAGSAVATFDVHGGRPVRWMRDAVERCGVRFVSFPQAGPWDPRPFFAAQRLVREARIRVLESHEYKTHAFCFLLKLATGLPWVAFTHGWTGENRKIACYAALDRALLRFADRVVTVSRAMRSHPNLVGVRRDAMVVVPNGVDPSRVPQGSSGDLRARLGISPEERVVGVVGRFSPEKGHRTFVEAFKILAAKIPGARAVLFGAGPEEERVRRLAAELGLGDRVIFAGFRADVADYYRIFDVLASPSHSEGMPNAVLEAMVSGVPVVATRVGGVPELIDPGVTGELVEAGDARALASALAEALEDRVRAAAMAGRAKKRALEEFTVEARNAKVLSLYRQLAGAR